jgi:hypothetical protein
MGLRESYVGGACIRSCSVRGDACSCERVAGLRQGPGGPKVNVVPCSVRTDALARFDVRTPDLRARFDAKDPALRQVMGLAHQGNGAIERGDADELRAFRSRLLAFRTALDEADGLATYVAGFLEAVDAALAREHETEVDDAMGAAVDARIRRDSGEPSAPSADDGAGLMTAVTAVISYGTDAEIRKLRDALREHVAKREAGRADEARAALREALARELRDDDAHDARQALAKLEEYVRTDSDDDPVIAARLRRERLARDAWRTPSRPETRADARPDATGATTGDEDLDAVVAARLAHQAATR